MKIATLILATTLLSVLLTGATAAADVKDEPGYMDLEWIEIPADAEEVQDIDLGPVLLSLAADAEEVEDAELIEALSMVRSLRVKAFSVDENDSAEVDEAVKKIRSRLERDDWEQLISIRDRDESVTVSIKKIDEDIVGLVVVAYEAGEEASFVNVVGDLDLARLMKFALGRDEGDLEQMIEDIEDSVKEHDHRDNDDG